MTRISTFLLAVFALNIAQIPSTALANAYEKSAFLKKFGYQDAKISRARWKVKSYSSYGGMDFAVAMALHRTAILAKSAGFKRFSITSLKMKCMYWNGGSESCNSPAMVEEVIITSVGLPSKQPYICEEKGKWAPNCRGDVDVEETLIKARPTLLRSVEDQVQEVKEVRASYRWP